MRGLGNRHGARFGRRLHPRGDIGSVAEYIGIFASAGANHNGA